MNQKLLFLDAVDLPIPLSETRLLIPGYPFSRLVEHRFGTQPLLVCKQESWVCSPRAQVCPISGERFERREIRFFNV